MIKQPQEKKFNELVLSEIVSLIRQWPFQRRLELVQGILHSFDTRQNLQPDLEQRKQGLAHLWSLLPKDMPEITDEQLDEMKIEWRSEKHD